LIENDALKKMSLNLNSKFGLLACFCGSTLNSDNWIRHLRNNKFFIWRSETTSLHFKTFGNSFNYWMLFL